MEHVPLQKLRDKFFTDPDWKGVEKLIMDFINPLIEMQDVDVSQPAEHVKAELIGRQKLYKEMTDFLQQTGLVGNPAHYKKENNPFQ
jgi:hypothetical protein